MENIKQTLQSLVKEDILEKRTLISKELEKQISKWDYSILDNLEISPSIQTTFSETLNCTTPSIPYRQKSIIIPKNLSKDTYYSLGFTGNQSQPGKIQYSLLAIQGVLNNMTDMIDLILQKLEQKNNLEELKKPNRSLTRKYNV